MNFWIQLRDMFVHESKDLSRVGSRNYGVYWTGFMGERQEWAELFSGGTLFRV